MTFNRLYRQGDNHRFTFLICIMNRTLVDHVPICFGNIKDMMLQLSRINYRLVMT